jgi:hypothetical protein
VASPERGEVWLADLGLAAKVRPVLVVSVPFGDLDYALIQVVPHTTQPRGGQFELCRWTFSGPSLPRTLAQTHLPKYHRGRR